MRNEEYPPLPSGTGMPRGCVAERQNLSVAEGGWAVTQNSKLKTQNSETASSLRLVSVASEPGATPRVQGLVRVAAGPWTLEDGWWSDQPVERDYWDVELSGGGLYRIYRDRTTGEWFADGMYD